MKHGGPEALDRLEPLLAALRGIPGLRERSRGVFYLGGRAFVHFHEDPEGLFADLRTGERWTRLRVGTAPERRRLLQRAARGCRLRGRGR
ncbi:MAG: hypothetical protein L0216_02470 [Planctomycetales bacterium]|nr:hypothetical protein [Planctomycetales bacterium]